MSTPSIDPADEAMLEYLGRLAEGIDPAPPLSYELGRAAWAMRRVDVELAQLISDSAFETAGVRGEEQARLLSFEAGEILMEVQISPAGDRGQVLGQIVPPPGTSAGVVRLEVRDGTSLSAPLDEVGGFRFEGVPLGLVRFYVELPDVAAVTTTWVSL